MSHDLYDHMYMRMHDVFFVFFQVLLELVWGLPQLAPEGVWPQPNPLPRQPHPVGVVREPARRPLNLSS